MKKYLLAVALLFAFSAIALAQHKKTNLNIVFIGNSITQGVQLADVMPLPKPRLQLQWHICKSKRTWIR